MPAKIGRSNFLRVLFASVAALVCLFAARPAQPGAQKPELTVSAAISLKDALGEIQVLYRAEHPDTAIHLNLGASGTLQQQVEQGAPVDVFISASSGQMDALESEGLLIPETRKNLLRNELVLIVPNGETLVTNFADLTRPDVKHIAIGEPQTVPAGKYAQEVLTHLGSYKRLKAKLVLAKDVRQVLTYVATGNADAGIVYATDARTSSQVKIEAVAPEGSHSLIVYPAAVLKASKNVSGAKSFLDFLFGLKARAVFQKYGFIPAGE
ncbi:MAG: molybdate ABC transporter substrate-binding protein [Candidatus Acidiferrales bacterium]